MVRSRMEARLEALEKNFEKWRQTLVEDREVRGTHQELNDARLKRVKELLEAILVAMCHKSACDLNFDRQICSDLVEIWLKNQA